MAIFDWLKPSRAWCVLTLLFLFTAGSALRAQLPAGWTGADIGGPSRQGSVTVSGATWTVEGGGSDIWTTWDQFYYVYRTSNLDGEIKARVETQELTDTWAKAGVMYRDSTGGGSMFAMVVVTPGNGVNFQWRSATGGECNYSQIAGVTAPCWVKLVRSGDMFAGYYSSDGQAWTAIGPSQVVSMSPTPLAGIAVTAHNDTLLCTATFSNVSASDTSAPSTAGFGVYRELWTGLSASAPTPMDALTNTAYNPNWPNYPVPAYTKIFTNIETGVNSGLSEYGQRLRGFLVPPQDGAYLFNISSDDSSLLYVSSDEDPAHASVKARVDGWTNSREWAREPNQLSAAVSLERGRRYYFEILMRQGGGGDNLAVRWALPDGTWEEPIPATSTAGTRLVPCDGKVQAPGIYEQTGNQNLLEGASVRLSVLCTNRTPVGYQWRLQGTNLPGATALKPFLSLSNVLPAVNNGQVYTCVVSNSAGSVTSAPILLTVTADLTPPSPLGAMNLGSNVVQIKFSELLNPQRATNASNYSFTNGVAVTGATLTADGATVILNTGALALGSNYTILLRNLQDRATVPNTLASNTPVTFVAAPYAVDDVGQPGLGTEVVQGADQTVQIQAAGSGIGGLADQFAYAYQWVSGDFDIRVPLKHFTAADVWAKAGLMARESLGTRSRFAAVIDTPAMHGVNFEWRNPEAAASQTVGNFPPNYPNSWLRLKRAGSLFTGYAGYDGQSWTTLGSATIDMPASVYVGLAVSSQNPGTRASALFGERSNVTNATVSVITNPHEALGPSSRKSPIVVSEIMYKPAPRSDTNNLEYIELYNSNPWFHDIGGYQVVCDNLSYTFPAGTLIGAGAFLVVAASPGNMLQVYGPAGGGSLEATSVLGPYTGSLGKSGTLKLLDERGAELLIIPYSSEPPWPAAADGAGHSLVLANPSYGEADPRAWDISDVVGGSPGMMDAFRPSPLRNVVINEFLAHTDPPDWDYIELYNHSTQAVDISGCVLTDDPATNLFVIPNGTVIPPRGFAWFSETNLPFALNAAGETIYFKSPDLQRCIDTVRFNAQENGVARGRWPDGARDFYRLAAKTPGTNNAAIRQEPVVLNEIMYHPLSPTGTGSEDWQYVELYNRSGSTLSLAGWDIDGGIHYTFGTNVVLGPGAYLVVARNAAHLMTNYPNLNPTNCLGDFEGKLSGKGERLSLRMPDTITSTNSQGVVSTNRVHITVNELEYGTGGQWGTWADGGGSSLELTDPNSNNRLARNWADSDETQKSSWVNIECTGVLDNGANYTTGIEYAQIGLLDVGECLVDDIEVLPESGTPNLVVNSSFESGLSGWSLQGGHVRSSLESSGYLSTRSLHIRASSRLWTGDNSCQVQLSTNTVTLAEGQIATLRFKARWLHGWPEVLLRLNGNWLEATGRMPVPSNPGTPGARNSRFLAAAPPAIYEVTHTPAVPAASQKVVVTARMHSAAGLRTPYLYYRVDPSTTYSAVLMRDDGNGDDAVGRDGIYSAAIPAQASGTIVSFYLDVSDSQYNVGRFPALLPDNAPVRECVVRFGDPEPAGSFGVYHLWINKRWADRWSGMTDLSNESHDCTFVNGKRVIYGVQGRFAGSPYHQGFDTPYGNLCHYKWVFPKDDCFLGATSFNKIHQPGNGAGDDASLQREQLANSLLRTLGVPWLNRRYVAVYVDGNRRGTLMEDTQTPDDDVVAENFPNDAEGWLYKMQPWFEFGPFPSGGYVPFNNASWCNLMPYTTAGGMLKPARYRYNFLFRQTPGSANDFTNVFSLIQAASSYGTPNYAANMQNVADMENWMRVFAANHAAGNWDSFGANNAQNLYGYTGRKGTRYSLLMFDFNIVFGNSGSWAPGEALFTVNWQDPNTANIYSEPTFRRMYWRALQELVNGPLDVANSGPLLDAKYRAFVANGQQVENPGSTLKSWLTQARNSIAAQLASENTSGFSVNKTVTVSNNLAVVTGTAPVSLKTIRINGAEWPLTWTGLGTWRIQLPLASGSNFLSVVGVDREGTAVAGASNYVSAVYNGTMPALPGLVVLNEILYLPSVPDSEYVELYNTSSNLSVDLSGCELRGLSYTFPAGSMIAPRQTLVLAANRMAFAAAYGATVPVFDTYDGNLQKDGETLTLVKPGTPETVIAKVKYGSAAPWPEAGPGNSLQLLDASQDNWRIGNWGTVPTTPEWRYIATNITATSSVLYIYLASAGDIYVDDITLVGASGSNAVTNGDFESPLSGPWTLTTNFGLSVLSTDVKHSGGASLHLVATAAGTGNGNAIYQALSPGLVQNATYTLGFWYRQSTNGGPLILRLSGGSPVGVNPAPTTNIFEGATPARTNSLARRFVPMPTLWLNELQAENTTGITNSAGQRVPWVELFNPGTNAVTLQGLYLSGNRSNPAQWAFPAGISLGARQFKVVFADSQVQLSKTNELHANFCLQPGSGDVLLSRLTTNGTFEVLDWLPYSGLNANRSYGSIPDAQSFERREMFYATPGATNNPASPPASVFINEWMADNTSSMADPADGDFEDWFELYNAGSETVDLGNFYLSDTLTNKFKYQIPANGHYVIPPHGFLLVWADGEPGQNSTNRADLHADFKLDKAGEAIGLFGADGTTVDYVTFGPQTNDIAMGRIPDGTSSIGYPPWSTPGTNNAVPNTAPVIAPIPDQYVYLGQSLGFRVSATDAQSPPQILTFTLDPGAPATAVLNNLGWFSWAPLAAELGAHPVTARVQDNGVPFASSTCSFTITVLAPPALACVAGPQSLSLSWFGVPGQKYRLESTDDLAVPVWTPASPDILGAGASASLDVTVRSMGNQFFRVAVLP